MIGLKFGTFNLQDPANGIWVTGTDVYSAPANNIQADTLVSADGALIVKQQYASKTFTVDGILRKNTIAELEACIDAFKIATSIHNQAFDLDYAGGIRRYLASAQNVIIAKRGNTTASFSVQFLSPDGVGWDIGSSSFLATTGTTLSNVSYAVTVGGSYQAEPLITVVVNTITGGTSKTMTVTNGVSLRGISVTRTWTAGDRLEIDSLKQTIYVNDIAQEFRGQFPKWEVGSGSIVYLDDFTARDTTISASYTKRWL